MSYITYPHVTEEQLLRCDVRSILSDPRLVALLREAARRRADLHISPERLLEAWETLSPDHRLVWRRYYNLDGRGRCDSYKIAALLGLSRNAEAVRRLRLDALWTLQAHLWSLHRLGGLQLNTRNLLQRHGVFTPAGLRLHLREVVADREMNRPRWEEVEKWLANQGLPTLSHLVPPRYCPKLGLPPRPQRTPL